MKEIRYCLENIQAASKGRKIEEGEGSCIEYLQATKALSLLPDFLLRQRAREEEKLTLQKKIVELRMLLKEQIDHKLGKPLPLLAVSYIEQIEERINAGDIKGALSDCNFAKISLRGLHNMEQNPISVSDLIASTEPKTEEVE